MARKKAKRKPTKARFSVAKQNAFLSAFAKCGTILHAANAAGINRETVRTWRSDDESFAERFSEAQKEANELLEAEARRRAIQGCRRKKFTKNGDPIYDPETGEQYEELVYSDTLLIFLLKGNDPEKYRERTEVTGSIEQSGEILVVQLPEKESDK